MKIKDIRFETDNQGEKKVIEQSNGICIKILKNPSAEYKAKLQARAEKEKKRMQIEKENRERDKLIKERMYQIAEEQLKKEGKI